MNALSNTLLFDSQRAHFILKVVFFRLIVADTTRSFILLGTDLRNTLHYNINMFLRIKS